MAKTPFELRNEVLAQRVVKNLQRRAFDACYCATKEEALEQILSWMEGDYRQLAIETTEASAQALVSKMVYEGLRDNLWGEQVRLEQERLEQARP